jgi:predicted transcriptional regulator
MQGNTMNFKYNPGFSSDEELIDAFVVRQKELQQILQTIQENTGRTYQHLLLVGARGTGKTMLVRRVAAEIRRSPELNQHWYPLVFGEESYRILSAGEFWLEALNHLAAQNPGSPWQGVYEELRGERDEKRLQQRAIAKLMDFADAQNKQILLIVENLNMLFDEQMSAGDDWDLRHTLQNEPRLMLLGTATQRFDEIDNVDKAWFEFFALHTMEPLNLNECSQLWKSIAEEDLSSNQMRPMQILTGGNPRLLQILAGFSRGMSFRDLMVNLTQLIDSHTDYFKNLLERLPATERKVFVELLECWEPVNASRIADKARMAVSKTSAILNRLLSRGAIEVVQQPSKKKYYQVAERLFNIYYLMRKRGATENQIEVIIDFMAAFYPDLVEQARWIVEEAINLSVDDRIYHLLALSLMIQRSLTDGSRNEILEIIPEGIKEQISTLMESRQNNTYFTKDRCAQMLKRFNFNSMSNQNIIAISACDWLSILGYIGDGIDKDWDISNNTMELITTIILGAAVAGYADYSLTMLIESAMVNKLEPLITGLKIFLGEERPLVPQEVFEVGKDIADRIRSKQAELANSSNNATQ